MINRSLQSTYLHEIVKLYYRLCLQSQYVIQCVTGVSRNELRLGRDKSGPYDYQMLVRKLLLRDTSTATYYTDKTWLCRA